MGCAVSREIADWKFMGKLSVLYCCFYKLSERLYGRSYSNHYSASIMMSLFLMIVGGGALSLVALVFDVRSFAFPGVKIFSVGVAVLVFLVVNKSFASGGSHDCLLNRFDSKKGIASRRPELIAVSVILGSIAFLVTTWILLFASAKPA